MKAVLKVINNNDIEISYLAMDAASVQASHLPCNGFQKNPAYIYENERQYHKEPASQDAIVGMSFKLDAGLLLSAPTAIDGAPIIDSKNNILGGNCRTMAIQRAYCYGSAGNYRKAVIDFCAQNGIDCDCDNPILVRRIEKDIAKKEGQELISLLNDSFTASKTVIADCYSRGTRFTAKTLKALAIGLAGADSLRSYFDSAESSAIIDLLIADGVIQYNEKNAYINGGFLNTDGKALIEKALRSIVATDLEQISRLPAPILAKVDAIIPYIVICSNIKNWGVIDTVKRALLLMFEYVTSGEKSASIFLRKCSMLNAPAIDRYSHNEIAIFDMLRESGKNELVKRFKEYAFQADISIENNGMGFGLPQKEAVQKIFGFDNAVNNIENKEDSVMVNEISVKPVVNSDMEIKDVVKRKRTSKNDCTKANSKFIHAVTSEKDDKEQILFYISENICADFELMAISKTQYKIMENNIDNGYRLIRSGRQWQVRLLNEYNMPEKITETAQDNNIKEESKNNIIEIDGRKFEFDNGKRITCKQKSYFAAPYNLNCAKAYAAYYGNVIIYRNGINNNYYALRDYEIAGADIQWSQVTELYFVDSQGIMYKKISELPGKSLSKNNAREYLSLPEYIRPKEYMELPKMAENKYNLDSKKKEIEAELEKLGWQRNKYESLFMNVNGGFKGTINPTGKRHMTLSSYKNTIFIEHGWDNLFTTEIDNDITPCDIAKELHDKLIAWAKKTGKYDDIDTLDGAIKAEPAPISKDMTPYLAGMEYIMPTDKMAMAPAIISEQRINMSDKDILAKANMYCGSPYYWQFFDYAIAWALHKYMNSLKPIYIYGDKYNGQACYLLSDNVPATKNFWSISDINKLTTYGENMPIRYSDSCNKSADNLPAEIGASNVIQANSKQNKAYAMLDSNVTHVKVIKNVAVKPEKKKRGREYYPQRKYQHSLLLLLR